MHASGCRPTPPAFFLLLLVLLAVVTLTLLLLPAATLCRTLADNMVVGVSSGFEKRMEMVGTGYRASTSGKELTLNVGYSKPRVLPIPEGVTVKVKTGGEAAAGRSVGASNSSLRDSCSLLQPHGEDAVREGV